jgi:DNA-binding GntR family transcriptional regulator
MTAPIHKFLSTFKIERGALAEKVATILRKGIIQGKFMPGDRLPEIWLAKQLGVSRAPIREAIRILEIEGLVEVVLQKGARVRRLTSQDVGSIYELRSALDSLAIRLAIPNLHEKELSHLEKLLQQMKSHVERGDSHSYQRLNSEFHDFFYEKSQNQWLCDAYNNLMRHVMRLRSFSLSLSDRLNRSYTEHVKIVEAVKGSRVGEAEDLSRGHTKEAGRFVLQAYVEQEKKILPE